MGLFDSHSHYNDEQFDSGILSIKNDNDKIIISLNGNTIHGINVLNKEYTIKSICYSNIISCTFSTFY